MAWGVQEPQAVPESELPLVLPETDKFKPSGSPESPLANISDWVSFTDPETGHYQLPHLHPSDASVHLLVALTQ